MSDIIFGAVITLAGGVAGAVIKGWLNRRKVNSDAYSTLLNALNTGGKTIDDLFGMLAELPQLQSQIRTAQDEIKALKRNALFWVSFARVNYDGARLLHAQLVRIKETPEWYPPEKFPTGPLENVSA